MTEDPSTEAGRRGGRVTRSQFADADGDETHDPVPPGGGASVAGLGRSGTDDTAESAFHRVDAAYREWTQDRSDVGRLRRLRDVVGECLRDAGSR